MYAVTIKPGRRWDCSNCDLENVGCVGIPVVTCAGCGKTYHVTGAMQLGSVRKDMKNGGEYCVATIVGFGWAGDLRAEVAKLIQCRWNAGV